MARIIGPKCRKCRSAGEKMFYKGTRCTTVRCTMERNPQRPGQHGAKRQRLTDYGIHLREKQKLKKIYGLTDRAFRNYFLEAQRMTGNTGENMLIMMETRLDNVVASCGWAASRPQGRQLICHRHVAVNGRIVNIPSYRVEAGDLITVYKRAKSQTLVKAYVAETKKDVLPNWVKLTPDPLQIQIVQLPKREDITVPINEQLVVEFATR
ncbi:MAG: 30S ribosomal protein S4 [Candidatus Brocadiia bacterium]